MGITVHGQFYPGNEVGHDLSSHHAETLARELHDIVGSDCCTKAVVDHMDGLLLFISLPSGTVTQHFNNAVTGYGGTGPITSAIILELFGFGTKDELMAVLGTTPYHEFVK